MQFSFEKWHGCANDFIVFWISRNDGEVVVDMFRRKAPELCARDGRGIGADGVLLLHTETKHDVMPYQMTILNADGSEAAACGNGTRCAVASVLKKHQDYDQEIEHGLVELQVQGRPLTARILEQSTRGWPYVMVDMGPFALKTVDADLQKRLQNDLQSTQVCDVEIGNAHIVVMQDQEPSIARLAQARLQDVYQNSNVHLVQECESTAQDQNRAHQILQAPIEQKFKVQTWERGVGPTQACASGVCAIGASAMAEGFISDGAWMAMENPGGMLYCKQQDGHMIQVGPAERTFTGCVDL